MDNSTLDTRTSTESTLPAQRCQSVYLWEETPWRCAMEPHSSRVDHITDVAPDVVLTWTDAHAEPTEQDRTPDESPAHHQPKRRNP